VAREQMEMGEGLSRELRNTYLALCGGVLTCLIVVLGIGLYRLVVAPIRSLQRATQAVTRGDLEVAVSVPSGDEIGALAADFAVMVGQLRESRAALTNLNRNLEDEVARKTRHLQATLDDLGRTHKQLAHAEKMAAIGTLAGGVAHEFNNLVGGIRGCASEVLAGEQDTGRRETLEVILRATDRARTITRRLLDFSRRRVDAIRPLDVATVLDDALRLIEHEAKQRDVRVVRRFAPGLALEGDADALHQVFLNLFTNALQAMPRGGVLAVEAERSATELSVRVADTGTGIAPEHIDHVFEPFYTSKDREKDPAARGSGLGLSVSFGLVAAHGGTMLVQSTPGAGAVFTVVLPLARVEQRSADHDHQGP
jgi:signal transduction histidine kinase